MLTFGSHTAGDIGKGRGCLFLLWFYFCWAFICVGLSLCWAFVCVGLLFVFEFCVL